MPAVPEHWTVWTKFDPLISRRRKIAARNTLGGIVNRITDPIVGYGQSFRRGNLAGGKGYAAPVRLKDPHVVTFRNIGQGTVVRVAVKARQALERSPTEVRPPRGGGGSIEYVLWGDNRK